MSWDRAVVIADAEVSLVNAAKEISCVARCDTCCASCRHSTQRCQVDLGAQVMLLCGICGDQQSDIEASRTIQVRGQKKQGRSELTLVSA